MPKGVKGFIAGHRHTQATKDKISASNSRKVKFNCDMCGKVAHDKPSSYKRKKRHFCSQRCYSNFRMENMQPNEQPTWRGGITKETQQGRGCKKYKMWQRMIFERDGFKCVWCNSKERIEADHIKRWATHPELRYNVDNGRTLCLSCHNKTRNKKYYENPELPEVKS